MTLPDFVTETPEEFLQLSGHRIGLHHIIVLYNEGYSPEMLWEQFPTLPLALIHKAIAFYLENQPELDAYVTEHDKEMQRQRAAAPKGPTVSQLKRRLTAHASGPDEWRDKIWYV